ncbi:MAG: FAD-dependent oxidoreductase [Rhodospirillaceae bacterium]|nr:FAD-dependent oxidoreductase [Rhodospirillaceae bacterium]
MTAPSEKLEAHVDFLVIGGGMAGMTAAARAAKAGRRVMVVEKAPDIGGSAVLSGGKLWTAATLAMMAEECPGGDAALQRKVFDRFESTAAWLRSTGITVEPESRHLHYGRGYNFDVVGYIAACRMLVEGHGGYIIRGAFVTELIKRSGCVVGARVADRDGITTVHAPAVLLASGGFSASPELLRSFVHFNADKALARSNQYSVGDGMRLGLAAGGSLSANMGGFYGHVMQSPVLKWGPREYRAYTQGGSIKGLLLNQSGQRFCDESLGDHQNAQRILEQPNAKVLLVFDQAVREAEAQTILANTDKPIDKVAIALDEGGRVAIAETWRAVFEKSVAWGFAADQCLATVEAYNKGGATQPGRVRDLYPYLKPPFYALETQCGVTATHGGLRVDDRARVLDGDGGAVGGLFAAGADAGNIYGGGYAGGLSFAATFGLLSAEEVLVLTSP